MCPRLHLPLFVTRQLMGLTLWEEQVFRTGNLSILLAPFMKNYQDLPPVVSFQVPELPGPGLRRFSKFNSENLLDLHRDPSRPVISLTVRRIIKFWSLLTQQEMHFTNRQISERRHKFYSYGECWTWSAKLGLLWGD